MLLMERNLCIDLARQDWTMYVAKEDVPDCQ